MSQDIDAALYAWNFKPGSVKARLIRAGNGREVLQMRVDLGVLQMETSGRPDGARPHGCPTYFDYLRRQARAAARQGQELVLSEEQCREADREFVQFYHRRISWLALRQFDRAVADADHTLEFMDFVRDHSPSEEYTQAHEQYRGFVWFHRTQAAVARAIERKNPEEAIDEIRGGLEKLRAFFVSFDAEEHMKEDSMVQQLLQLEKSLRETHGIEATLHEQLDQAVAREDYETAAKLRDALRRRPEE